MKNLFYFLILVTPLCYSQSKEGAPQARSVRRGDNAKYYTTKDPLIIITENKDTLRFTQLEFNTIVDNHLEFFSDFPASPDHLYYAKGGKGNFDSEVGQDTYYTLYAYFLMQKNGREKFSKERRNLIAIYKDINSLFEQFQNGGTYFGHQRQRIPGYAEYSVFLLPKDPTRFEKNYDISKQKMLYIQSLRQLIEDESESGENADAMKAEKTAQLNKLVDNLEKLITDIFYLRRAQEFQYEHYQYY